MTIFVFFFNDTATAEIYTLSLHDALPISKGQRRAAGPPRALSQPAFPRAPLAFSAHSLTTADRDPADRKSTRLNSSHANISYAVFCLKKKKHVEDHVYVFR